MRKILLTSIAAATAAVTCAAFAASSGGRGQDMRGNDRVEKALAGRVAGEPRACIPFREVENTRVLGDDLILYEGRGGKAWLNQTNGSCGLKPHLATRRIGFGNSICAGEIINVVDPRTNMPRGSCGLGDFTPYTRVSRR
jgi:hypothetical protein